ncbi:MAG: hypothetical protein IT449_12600 [Phycisphaerales bacterium]|nr:hypothetical protein [Phycisphaerales bacterium]
MNTDFGHGVDFAGGIAAEGAVVRGDHARITVLTPTLLRLEYDPDARFEDRPSFFALHRRHEPPRFSVRQVDDLLVVQTDNLRLKYKLGSGFFTADNLSIGFSPDFQPNRAGQEAMLPSPPTRASEPRMSRHWRPGDTNRRNLGGTVRTLDNCRGAIRLDDGLLSRDGWFLLDDTRTPVFTRDWVEARLGDGRRDWYFFGYGLDYKQALRDLVTVSGRVPVPPPFVFGNWYSRYWPYSAEDYRRLVEEFAERDFPLDVLVMDMDWHRPGWTGYSWNRDLIPDPDGLLKFFKDRGLAVTLNLHPASGVHPHEDAYVAFARTMGADPAEGRPIPFDCTSPRFMRAYFGLLHHPLERQGVDFWWLDWQQQKTSAISRLDPLMWLNHLHYHNLSAAPGRETQASDQRTSTDERQGGALTANRPSEDRLAGDRLVGDGLMGDRLSSRSCGKPPLIFSRWGGWGSQRYPIQFSGDAESTWDVLKFQVKLTATAGNAGCVYWSHDIGGHWSLEGRCNPELFVRWLQFGALSPILRVHSTRDPLNDRRPWLDGEPYASAARKAHHLREALRPHLLQLAHECHDTGTPLCRPMYMEYPACKAAYAAEHQYLLGADMLVVPVTTPGDPAAHSTRTRDAQGRDGARGAGGAGGAAWARCWLPEGEWIEWETATHYTGPVWLTFEVDLDALLIFLRPAARASLPESLRRPGGVRTQATGAPRRAEALPESLHWFDEWRLLGPFLPDARETSIDAALQCALSCDLESERTWHCRVGLIYDWRRYRTIAATVPDPAHRLNHAVNMKAVFGELEATGIAVAELCLPAAAAAALILRHDDPLTLYINGRAAYSCEKVRPVYDPPERIAVELRAGSNRIVIEQRQFGDRWGFDLEWCAEQTHRQPGDETDRMLDGA